MKQKAQIAAFVILAVVVVSAIIIFFLLARKPEIQQTQGPSAIVSKQVQPVYDSINSCLDKTALKGLELLRLQAGYIYLPTDVEIIEADTDSGKRRIPLWLSENKISIPSLAFMENQLAKYIESELPKCTDNFQSFRSRNFDISTNSLKADVTFGEQVQVNLNWPVSIVYKEESFRFDKFLKTININIPSPYNVAVNLTLYELGYNYLEQHAKSLISLYSYAGGSKGSLDLPPMSFTDTNTDCNFVYWTFPEVESSLASIFSENYKYLKMAGTDFTRTKAKDAVSQGVFDSFIKDYFKREMKNIQIDFSYSPEFGMNLYMYPPSLMPERTSQSKIPFLPSFCSFSYEFKYTVSSPILVKIKDSNMENVRNSRLSEKGFQFYFPMKMYICDDEPRGCTNTQPDTQINLQAIEQTTGAKFYDCKDIDRETGVSVKDDMGLALDGVDITHYCSSYANDCWLGRTSNGKARISLPKCENSTLELYKPGYGRILDSVKSEYTLDKSRSFTVEIKLVKAEKFAGAYLATNGFKADACGKSPGTWLSSSIYDVTSNDNIILSVGGIGGKTIIYPSTKSIELAPGNYEITAAVQSNVTIKPSQYSGQIVSFNTKDKTKPYTGKWLLGTSQYTVTLLRSEMVGKSKITFYVFTEHLSTEQLQVSSFENSIIDSTGLQGKIEVDDDCDGKQTEKTVSISTSQYINIIKPKFS